MIRLNYRRDRLGPREREYQYGSATVNGITFTDAWLVRTGKNGVLKRYARDAAGGFLLNQDRTDVLTEVHRGRVKARKAKP